MTAPLGFVCMLCDQSGPHVHAQSARGGLSGKVGVRRHRGGGSMTTARDIRQGCKARGCRITWSYEPAENVDNGQAGIDVDHCSRTTSGSKVFVYRKFSGELAWDGSRLDWNAEQCAAVSSWVDRLHRMPLEEIP